MQLAAYVVVHPRTREDILWEILSKIATSGSAELTLRAVDIPWNTEKKVSFVTRQTQTDGFSHFFSGYFIDPEDHQQYLFNLTIPPWDSEEATVKIMHSPFPSQEA